MTRQDALRVVLVGPGAAHDDAVLRRPGVEVRTVPLPRPHPARSRVARLLREVVAPSVVALGVLRVAGHRKLLRVADVVVATSPEAVLAVRLAGVRNRRAALVNGLPAARRHVVRAVSAGES